MIDIVICTDDNYLMPSGVLVHSILKNNKSCVSFHIVSEKELSCQTKTAFDNLIMPYYGKVSLSYYTYNLSNANIPVGQNGQLAHLSSSAYLRLFLCDVLPQTMSKVLYLDCDIICRKDLSELWNIDISDYAVGCAKEAFSAYFYNNIHLEQKYDYFNSGVLLINLDYWRSNGIKSECLDYIEAFPERCKCFDQDALNYVLRDRKKIIHRKYNAIAPLYLKSQPVLWTDFEEAKEAAMDPVLVHYSGATKPWNSYCPHPLTMLFKNYQSATIWGGQILDKGSKRKKLIKRLLYHITPTFLLVRIGEGRQFDYTTYKHLLNEI